jgi:hypothetical protein
MGAHSAWIGYITDPSALDAELMQALTALDLDINKLYQAEYTEFTYDVFYSSAVANVKAALIELAESIYSSQRQLITIPNLGTSLADATNVFQILASKTGALGLGRIALETAPTGTACALQIVKNGTNMYSFSFAAGISGPLELDLSFISLVAGDTWGIYCLTASGAVGLSASVEF